MHLVVEMSGLCYTSSCKSFWEGHFSVYFQIEPGEFDGSLSWPSDLEVTVHLLHPKGDHYQPEQSIKLMQFPNGRVGWNKYIDLEEVDRYITNNVLYFRVSLANAPLQLY